MPILTLKPTPCDDIGVVLRTLKTRVYVSMDIRVDLAKETARPRHFFCRRKNDPTGRETTPNQCAKQNPSMGERHDEVGARSPADVLLAAEYPELLDDGVEGLRS